MKNLRAVMLMIIAALILPTGIDAQTRSGQNAKVRLPRFTDYPARDVFKGRPAPVRFNTQRARMFRTRLREDSREGPNFAGHYTIVFWGCGTGCAQIAVVDAKTGRVYWLPLEWVDIPDPESGKVFRLDSKLLIVTRSNYDTRMSYTEYYYLFENSRFRLLRRAEGNHVPSEDTATQ